MILYNMRHRGPLEYDKFALNTLQFHNEINHLYSKEITETTSNKNALSERLKELNDDYSNVVNQSESLYMKLLNYKEW